MAYKQKGWTPFTQGLGRFTGYIQRGPNPARGQKRRKAWGKFKDKVVDIFTKDKVDGSGHYKPPPPPGMIISPESQKKKRCTNCAYFDPYITGEKKINVNEIVPIINPK